MIPGKASVKITCTTTGHANIFMAWVYECSKGQQTGVFISSKTGHLPLHLTEKKGAVFRRPWWAQDIPDQLQHIR